MRKSHFERSNAIEWVDHPYDVYHQLSLAPRSEQEREDLKSFKVLSFFKTMPEKPIYQMGLEFSLELDKVNLDLTPDYLPILQSPICIEFPDFLRANIICEDNRARSISCAYVWLNQLDNGDRAFHIVLISGNTFLGSGGVLKKGKEIIDFHENTTNSGGLFKFIFKCLIYINSGDPDLRRYQPPKAPLTQDKKKQRRFQKENEDKPLIPITLVGFDFKKPKIFSVNSTDVMGHFRWQKYGPEFSLVKLIWIDPHVRHFSENKYLSLSQ